MKHYLKLSGVFLCFTFGVTLWMSYELGLLGFQNLNAAEEINLKPESEKKENKVKLEAETKEVKIVKPEAPSAPSAQAGAELSLVDRERYVSDREEFLKKQSEYYEKVIFELQDKNQNIGKENKQNLSKQEAQWRVKLEKAETEWKVKIAEKEAENEKLKKELAIWKDARAELFRGMYEKMESKRSAKILETMDVDLSNKIIAGMKQEKAAEVMSKMLPEKAKLITERTFENREPSSLDKVNKTQGESKTKSP